MKCHKFARWSLFLALVVVSACFSDPVRAQSASATEFHSKATWVSEYYSGFDKFGRPFLPSLRKFVSRLEEEFPRTKYERSEEDNAYLLLLLADAHSNLGDWTEAEKDYLAVSPPIMTYESSQWINSHLAGVYAMQGRWPHALDAYFRWIGSRYLQVVLPLCFACLAGLFLWQLGTRFHHYPRIPRRVFWRLVLFAFLPLIQAVFNDELWPVNSYLFTRNAFAFLASEQVGETTGLALIVEWMLGILLATYWIRKWGWLGEETALTDEATLDSVPLAREEVAQSDETTLDAVPLAREKEITRSSARRWGLFLLIALLGLVLDFGTDPREWKALMYLPGSFHTARSADTEWMLSLLITSILSPVVQEIFFRATLYTYARRTAGVGFGLVFSSLVFAAYHLRLEEFPILFMAGVIYALQYELTQHLAPSTVSHVVHNFLVTITRLR